jgi:thioredoxin-related protein
MKLKALLTTAILGFTAIHASGIDITSDPIGKESYKFDSVQWEDYRAAYSKRDLKKPMFVMVGSTTCKFCGQAQKIIDSDKEFVNYIMDNFTPVYISQDKDFVPVDLMAKGTPAFWFTSSSGMPYLQPIYGAVPTDMLMGYAKDIIKYKTR